MLELRDRATLKLVVPLPQEDARGVDAAGVRDTQVLTLAVLETVEQPLGLKVALPEKDVGGEIATKAAGVTVPLGQLEALPLAAGWSVLGIETPADSEGDSDALTVDDGARDSEGDRVKGDAEPVKDDPAGAQNGPILDVGRCVPSMELSAEPVRADGDTVAVRSAEATVRETDAVRDTEPVRDLVRHTESVCETEGVLLDRSVGSVPEGDSDEVLDTEDVAHPDAVAPPMNQAGAMLDVGRCVPLMDASGVAESGDRLPDSDDRRLGEPVLVTDPVRDTEPLRETEERVDTVRETEGDGEVVCACATRRNSDADTSAKRRRRSMSQLSRGWQRH